MRLHEYQAKRILTKFGVAVPDGRVASNAGDAQVVAEELGGQVVVKAQVLAGGRGKAGGIRLVKNHESVEEIASIILGMEIAGLSVRKVFVEKAIKFNKEIYVAVTIDHSARCPVLIASGEGGGNIKAAVQQNPGSLARAYIDPLIGLMDYQIRNVAASIDLPRENWRAFEHTAKGLWLAYTGCDAVLAEINPLVATQDGGLVALDAKFILDDNALSRHMDLAEMRDISARSQVENEARKYGLTYHKLEGQIGCMVNGAGLAMATMDIIKLLGGKPANFLDIGGHAGAEKVTLALNVILSDPQVKALLIVIFGGLTRCDEVAIGLQNALLGLGKTIPIVVRLEGKYAEDGCEILRNSDVIIEHSLVGAAQKVIDVTGEGDSQ